MNSFLCSENVVFEMFLNFLFSCALFLRIIGIFLSKPLRVCILGPPAVGKTSVIKKLCEHYKLHHIQIQNVIEEAIAALVSFLIIYFLVFVRSRIIAVPDSRVERELA